LIVEIFVGAEHGVHNTKPAGVISYITAMMEIMVCGPAGEGYKPVGAPTEFIATMTIQRLSCSQAIPAHSGQEVHVRT
jgi:hypothetical protein